MDDISAGSSTKVSPAQDERLKASTRSMVQSGRSTHAQEWKDPEPSGEDQPDVDLAPSGTLAGGTPEGMTADDVVLRSELASYLGRAYPVDQHGLIEAARSNGAPDRLIEMLTALPEGEKYESLQEVWSALGRRSEDHRF